jgi:multidrug efflux pump subunit AcrA (membrane-fusion protein)
MSKSYKNTLTGHSVVLSLIGCLLAGGCGQGNGSQTNRGEAGKTAIPVEAQVIMPQSLESNIQATGTLLANEEVELRSEISGRVTGVFFEEGKRVKQGELLLKINDRKSKRSRPPMKNFGREDYSRHKALVRRTTTSSSMP